MKSVGEAMAMGRTFQESFQKAMRSLETGLAGWSLPGNWKRRTKQELEYGLRVPNPERMMMFKQAMEVRGLERGGRREGGAREKTEKKTLTLPPSPPPPLPHQDGYTDAQLHDLTAVDPWFLAQLRDLHNTEEWVKSCTDGFSALTPDDWANVKRRGFSDPQIATALTKATGKKVDPLAVRAARTAAGVVPSYRRVDTCAAEFEAATPYMYSCYDGHDESEPTNSKKVLILGGGPNRIGQGIEFDYCCCHASFSLRAKGYETIMMNSNPETVSTDYDTSSRLYFEPLTVEDVLNVVEKERPDGIIVQFGGQTPLGLATPLAKYLAANPLQAASGEGPVRIWGTQPESIDAAEDRDQWYTVLQNLNIKQPPGTTVTSEQEAVDAANGLGYPVMVRPSFVLGGRAMEIVYSEADVRRYINTAVEVDPERPVLVDKVRELVGWGGWEG